MTLRHLLSWKPWFYESVLPLLARTAPARADAILALLGRTTARMWPPRRRELTSALCRVRDALGLHADWNIPRLTEELAASAPRFLARDYLLDYAPTPEILDRFVLEGERHLEESLAGGRGVILLACHMGAHLSGVHWLFRKEIPVRLLIQRPSHISPWMQKRLDAPGPHPQSAFFLRRGMTAQSSIQRMMQARAALKDGYAIYLNGDIPWQGPNTRPGRLLGQANQFLSVWADLAVLTQAPVVPMFCSHLPDGRYGLTFDAPWILSPGMETRAVARFLERLEAIIAANPADAVAHLLWPCYSEPPSANAKRRHAPITPAAAVPHASSDPRAVTS